MEILVGHIYSNGKSGRFYSERKILDISTGNYTIYAGQKDTHTVRYQTVKGFNRGNTFMTLKRFKSWAREDVTNKF